MKNGELVDQLHEFRWSEAYLALRLGVHKNTVSQWCTGKTPVPGYCAEYLRVCKIVKVFRDEVFDP